MFQLCSWSQTQRKSRPGKGGLRKGNLMQNGTNTQRINSSNTIIDDLASIRLSAEPWRWRKVILAADLTAGAKVAAFAILEFMGRKTGYCFPSYQTIASTCGMTERGVRAAVCALKAAGFLRVVQRGCKQTNRYYLALPVTGMDAQGDRHDHDGVTVTTMTPNLCSEPLKEENLTDRPSSELLVRETAERHAIGKMVEETPTEPADRVIPRCYSDHMAYCRITAAVIREAGYEKCPKLPDGRYLDLAIWEKLPDDQRAIMTQRARKGVLRLSEVAEAVRHAGIQLTHQRAA